MSTSARFISQALLHALNAIAAMNGVHGNVHVAFIDISYRIQFTARMAGQPPIRGLQYV